MGGNCSGCYTEQKMETENMLVEQKKEKRPIMNLIAQNKIASVIKVQALVRGWMIRKRLSLRKLLK